LHLADTLEDLKIEEDSGVSLVPLLEFIHRHPSIHKLTLERGALLSASLVASTGLQGDFANLTILSAPASYIPYILPSLPVVEQLTIIFDPHLRFSAYARALATIDPAGPLHKLTLNFPHYIDPSFSANAAPWRADAGTGIEDRLHTIRVLEIKHFKFIALDVHRLVGWLSRSHY
jgi:hypothetical protein